MRKRLLHVLCDDQAAARPAWLDVTLLAQVELTDEDPSFPIEAALCPGPPDGWRASLPGPQVIRLVFDQPHALHHLCLMFVEE